MNQNLPDNVTAADLDRHLAGASGEEQCEMCAGEGTIIVTTSPEDAPEREQCPECNGKGVITYCVSERKAERKAEADERRADERRDE